MDRQSVYDKHNLEAAKLILGEKLVPIPEDEWDEEMKVLGLRPMRTESGSVTFEPLLDKPVMIPTILGERASGRYMWQAYCNVVHSNYPHEPDDCEYTPIPNTEGSNIWLSIEGYAAEMARHKANQIFEGAFWAAEAELDGYYREQMENELADFY
jgi:hypothetical protein